MSQIETLGILEEIESLVSDKLQVVSYKWLSRNFLVSSNAAKRLLQEFVKTHGDSFQVAYTLSGWLKNDPPSYHIKLVSGSKLEEAKQEFDGNCSVQVYSVQTCIPKDPATLWNTEFVQAEKLFKQPSALDNCLRDNRFCGIVNSFVKRNVDKSTIGNPNPQPKAEKSTVSPRQISKLQQSSPQVDLQSMDAVKYVKPESHEGGIPPDKGKVPLPAKKKIGENVKIPSGNEGSLANLWGRASTKSKPGSGPINNNNLRPDSTASAEAQICASEVIEDEDSDDEAQDVNFRRTSNGESNRKRRVVLDYSDDEFEDTISLASPDLPKGQNGRSIPEKSISNEQTENKLKMEEKLSDKSSNQLENKDSFANRSMNSRGSSGKIHAHGAEDDSKENLVSNGTSNSPKRRKILKTRIDERGREVTEVVWEGEDTEVKKAEVTEAVKAEDIVAKKVENNVANNSKSAPKKSPAIGTTAPNLGGKAGNKKGGNKDPKQGNILSFFKKV